MPVRIIFITLTLLFLLTGLVSQNNYANTNRVCNSSPDTTSDVVNFYDVQNDTVIYRKINSNLPSFAFLVKIINTGMYSPVKEIVIKDSETKKTIQTLDSKRDSLFVFNMEFNDFNFDGYLDLYLYDGCAILGNCFGKIFIYKPDEKQFVLDRAFDEMTSVYTDKEKKEIHSLNRCCAGSSSSAKTFKYFEGKLYLSKEVNMDYDGKSKFIYVITEYNPDGKLINTKKVESEEMGLEF